VITDILYIDPGSSYLVQVLIAAALGVAFFFKNIWLYLKSLFTRKPKTDKDN
jgi:hypothetical protein